MLWVGHTQAEPMTFASTSTPIVLLELFTSEGCSSCPQADRWLSGLEGDVRLWRELIPVAFHVDYWDYLGWQDPFGAPAHAERQRRYAATAGVSQVYTPGFVVQGREWRGWFSGNRLELRLGEAIGRLELTVDERARAVLRFAPASTRAGELRYTIVLLGFGLETQVPRGENAGKVLHHDFVVLGMTQGSLAPDSGEYRASSPVPMPSRPAPRYGIAAWVSPDRDPAPLQAVGGWMPRHLDAAADRLSALR